ncbi:MAG: hypothetical protein K2W82_04885 [Candidatus Obscuribacterales bacterium]|nr:hypothetical protein [Candidatus Obscuribacterales bacterium]
MKKTPILVRLSDLIIFLFGGIPGWFVGWVIWQANHSELPESSLICRSIGDFLLLNLDALWPITLAVASGSMFKFLVHYGETLLIKTPAEGAPTEKKFDNTFWRNRILGFCFALIAMVAFLIFAAVLLLKIIGFRLSLPF